MTTLAATSGPTAMWYLTRATGAVALVLLTVSVLFGILGPLRVESAPRWPRFAVSTIHRDVSLLVIVLTVLHVITSVLDGFAPIGLIDAIIPLRSPYRPLWLGFGALAFDLLLALTVTSLVRARLGYRTWRAVHWLAYFSWPVAALHGLGTGSDAKQAWMLALTALCLASVAVAVLIRVRTAVESTPQTRTWLSALALATGLGIVIFTALGPLRPGWARRAGTPASLLGGHSASASAGRAPGATTARKSATSTPATFELPRQFEAQLSGTIHQRSANGGELVDLVMRSSGGLSGILRIRLAGLPDSQGGVSLTGSQVDYAIAGMKSSLVGRMSSLVGDKFEARVTGSGQTLVLSGTLQIDNQAGTVTGVIAGRAA